MPARRAFARPVRLLRPPIRVMVTVLDALRGILVVLGRLAVPVVAIGLRPVLIGALAVIGGVVPLGYAGRLATLGAPLSIR